MKGDVVAAAFASGLSSAFGAAPAASPAHADPGRLLAAMIVSIGIIVALIAWLKLHPFLSLTIGSAILAIGVGTPVEESFTSFGKGFGSTASGVGVLIALGAMIGKLLSDSGGADRIVDTILSKTSAPWLPWAMALIAFIIGIPLFFEVGLVLLIPVIILVSRRGDNNLIRIGIPALAGLSVLHGLVPPHPGPLIAELAQHLAISSLLVGWLLAVLIRLATGSATVATITASGIVAPLAASLDPIHATLLVLAVGSGSLFFSHVNDAGFWMVKEYFGMSVGQTLRTWSVMETVISVVGLASVLLLSAVF